MKIAFLLLRNLVKTRLHQPFQLIKLAPKQPVKRQLLSQQPFKKQIDSDSEDIISPVVSKRITITEIQSITGKAD